MLLRGAIAKAHHAVAVPVVMPDDDENDDAGMLPTNKKKAKLNHTEVNKPTGPIAGTSKVGMPLATPPKTTKKSKGKCANVLLPSPVSSEDEAELMVAPRTNSTKKNLMDKFDELVTPGASTLSTAARGRSSTCAQDWSWAALSAKQDDLGELFSRPRVVPMAKVMGMKAEVSLDILTGWNALCAQDRALGLKLCNVRNMKVYEGMVAWRGEGLDNWVCIVGYV